MSGSPHGPVPPPTACSTPERNTALQISSDLPSSVDVFSNACYYANWRIYRNERPSSLRLDLISHIHYAFAWVREDGTVYLSDLWADVQIPVDGQCGCLLALVSFKQQYPHLKIILSIGGGGPGSQNMSIVAASRTARQNFAVSALDLVTNYGLDGIDIDWEHPSTPQEGLNYVQLLRTARQHMPSPAFFISSALPAGTWALRNIDLSQAQKYLDRVNLMCYDFSGPWTNQCGHHSQLFPPAPPYEPDAALCGHSAMEYVMSEGIPAEKLLMGIPVFGRSFIGARSLGDSYIGHGGNDGVYDYKDLPLPGTAEAFDATAGAAMCIGDDSGFVTYDNPESVRLKATYVRQRAMGGLFYWTATADGVGSRSLIEAGFSGLHQ